MFKYKSTEQEREAIKSNLEIGHVNAKTDIELSNLTGIDKRIVRYICAELLSFRIPVCNMYDGSGFFLAETLADLESCKARNHSYILSMLKKEYRYQKAIEAFGVDKFA
jgi:hypothetical protein